MKITIVQVGSVEQKELKYIKNILRVLPNTESVIIEEARCSAKSLQQAKEAV